ncbi:MAG: DUF3352 domain-containing protein [Chloroflexota bacterium]|nr:DUF3352 domain-containing protein [Chloroflexota bacterium]
MKRSLSLVALMALLALCVFPASAQPDETDWLTWIPADFVGALRLDTGNLDGALTSVNLNLLISSVLQPPRAHAATRSFDAIFPVTSFDLEGGTFDDLIVPWLGDQIVVGYRALGAGLTARADDVLLILPTSDPFQSLSVMRAALAGQDLLTQSDYRGVTVYTGDETAFAFTPAAILIGDDALIRAALDVGFGAAPRLTDTPTYQAVASALVDAAPRAAGRPQTPPVFMYFAGDIVAALPRTLFSADPNADAVFDALLGAVANLTPDCAGAACLTPTNTDAEATPEASAEVTPEPEATPEIGVEVDLAPERALLAGAADAIGIALSYDEIRLERARADVVIHTSAPVAFDDGVFDLALLDFVPRSAMIVVSGAADRAAYTALAGLPLANFAGVALSAFPITPSFGASVLPLPTGADVTAAVEGFLTLVGESGVNLRGDVLQRLTGGYVLALLPRPNNPTPTLNTPFDVLMVAEVDGDTAELADALSNTLRLLFGDIVEAETLTVRGQSFELVTASVAGDAVLQIAVLDGRIAVGTGDALPTALAAFVGDNRLVAQDRWTVLNQDGVSYFYADMPAVYNTFFPGETGEGIAAIRQVGITSRALTDDLLHVRLLVTLAL